MKVHIYLNFDGNCAEAFDFYKSVFGGEFKSKMMFGDMPARNGEETTNIDEEYKSRIMHMSLALGDNNIDLMGCDIMPGQEKKKHTIGSNMHISLLPASKEQADTLFDALKDNGGTVEIAMKDEFWGAYYGMCTDRFGVQWMINYDYNAQESGSKDNKADDDSNTAKGEVHALRKRDHESSIDGAKQEGGGEEESTTTPKKKTKADT